MVKIKGKQLHSPIQHAMGCMFLSEINPLIFIFNKTQKIGIHTCFVRHPLDIAFLDEARIIIELKKNMKPWSAYKSKYPAKYIVETKAREYTLKLGDKVTFL